MVSGTTSFWPLRLFVALERSFALLSAVVIMIMMAAICANVFARAVFNTPIGGVYETAQLLMVALVFLGAAYVQAEKGHISITFFYELLPPAGQRICQIAVLLLSIAFWALITYQMGLRAAESWRIGEYTHGVIRFPIYPSRTIIPLGTGLLTIRLVIDLFMSGRQALGTRGGAG